MLFGGHAGAAADGVVAAVDGVRPGREIKVSGRICVDHVRVTIVGIHKFKDDKVREGEDTIGAAVSDEIFVP